MSIAENVTIGVYSIVAHRRQLAARASIHVNSNVALDWPFAEHASTGVARCSLIAMHVSTDVRKNVAIADRMQAAALFRAARDASHNAVCLYHP